MKTEYERLKQRIWKKHYQLVFLRFQNYVLEKGITGTANTSKHALVQAHVYN
jgi:hypothetical protein